MQATKSIARKFLLRAFSLLLLGQALLFGWMVYDRYENEQHEATVNLQTLSKLMANAAARSLLDYDFTYFGILVDEALKGKHIKGIVLYDKSGLKILENQKKETGSSNSSESLITMTVNVMQGTEYLGKLDLKYNLDQIFKEISVNVISLGSIQIIIFLLVAMLVLQRFRKDLGDKLKLFGNSISIVSEGELSKRIVYKENDEFGVIANGIDFLLDTLENTLSKIISISDLLASSISQVNVTVSDTASGVDDLQKSTLLVQQTVRDATLSQENIIRNTSDLQTISRVNNEAVNEIQATFSGISSSVDNLNLEIYTLNGTIGDLSGSTKFVADLADKAASAVRAATDSVQSINDSVGSIEKVVRESTALTARTTEIISEKGIIAVDNAMTSMAKIDLFVTSLSQTISRLETRSKDIAKILSVIREVTDQAHLLSLNAQIIAGQAGENGRSFAVVANEMKLLSSKTNSSTKEIEAIIQTIQAEIKNAVSETRETTNIVQHGSSVVAGAEAALREILETSHSSANMVKGIEESTSSQNKLVEHVLTMIKQLQVLSRDIKKAAEDEDVSTKNIVKGISGIRNTIEMTKRSTEEQSKSLTTISDNIEKTTRMVTNIATASHQQLQMNKDIGSSMGEISGNGKHIVTSVNDVAEKINAIFKDLQTLRQEISFFRIAKQEEVD